MEKKELSFEENLKELETIVTKLESGDISLDDAINEYNKAMKLAGLCNKKLEEAKENLTKIVTDGEEKTFEVE